MRRPTGTWRGASAWLVLVALLGAVACSSGDDEPAEPTTTTTVRLPQTFTVGGDGEYATIQEALDAAVAGDLVLVGPGVYAEAVVVEEPGVVVRGVDRNQVVVDGGFEREHGFVVHGHGVVIENLTVRNFVGDGVLLGGDDAGLTGYRVSYVTTHNNGGSGVAAVNATEGRIDHSYASGNAQAGFAVSSCEPCSTVVDLVKAEGNQLGYSGVNSSDVVLAQSEWVRNRTGVVLDSRVGDAAPSQGYEIVGNLVADNNGQTAEAARTYRPLSGSGVVLIGTLDVTIERNTVVGNQRAGILLTSAADVLFDGGGDFPVVDNTVRDNVVEGAVFGGDLVLALLDTSIGPDGNCFAANQFGSSFPDAIESVAPCDGEGQAGFVRLLDRLELLEPGTQTIVAVQDVPPPALAFETMPDATTAPAMPATDGPPTFDTEALVAPPRP